MHMHVHICSYINMQPRYLEQKVYDLLCLFQQTMLVRMCHRVICINICFSVQCSGQGKLSLRSDFYLRLKKNPRKSQPEQIPFTTISMWLRIATETTKNNRLQVLVLLQEQFIVRQEFLNTETNGIVLITGSCYSMYCSFWPCSVDSNG